jgi:hypothetical protein
LLFKKQYPDFNLDELQKNLSEIITAFKKDLIEHTKESFFKAKDLSLLFAKLESFGVPANYIVKLKQDQNSILRVILRVNYLQKIQPIPSAFILVESIVVGLIGILLVTKMDSLLNELTAIGFIAFIFIYMFKLIKVLDTAFHLEGSTMDDVSLFHLEDQEKRISG